MKYLLAAGASAFALFFVACTSGGSGTTITGENGIPNPDGGGVPDAEEEEATQQAILVTNGTGTGCEIVPKLEIGQFGNPAAEPPVPSTPVPNGTKENGTVVAVFCKVAPKGGGFAVYATVGRSGTTFELEADVDGTGASSAAGVTLIGPDGTWSSETCTLSVTTPYQGVASGRYWAKWACTAATSTENITCDLGGEVRLENCTQTEN